MPDLLFGGDTLLAWVSPHFHAWSWDWEQQRPVHWLHEREPVQQFVCFLPVPLSQQDVTLLISCNLHDKPIGLYLPFPNIKIYHNIEAWYAHSPLPVSLSIHRPTCPLLLSHLSLAEEGLPISSHEVKMGTGTRARKGSTSQKLQLPSALSYF